MFISQISRGFISHGAKREGIVLFDFSGVFGKKEFIGGLAGPEEANAFGLSGFAGLIFDKRAEHGVGLPELIGVLLAYSIAPRIRILRYMEDRDFLTKPKWTGCVAVLAPILEMVWLCCQCGKIEVRI